ncbi:hypothetical protein BON30_04505 [Cystobacter ferrugineus]|uniref:Sigma-54 factor interaction domain-containing protein n=1 Tax=Cystobacter ferrugineus TaxID=83449 RepID=A0A1L9BJL9_9BACT|nr:hypothetical protein BON30_04505 [Cystobacter ferrugineus]
MLPVGGTRPVAVDLRVIAATNRDLGRMVREGQLEARLALGEVELVSGKTHTGLTRPVDLESDARKNGWLLWARKAASLRASAEPR